MMKSLRRSAASLHVPDGSVKRRGAADNGGSGASGPNDRFDPQAASSRAIAMATFRVLARATSTPTRCSLPQWAARRR